jgi:hypothetical protein
LERKTINDPDELGSSDCLSGPFTDFGNGIINYVRLYYCSPDGLKLAKEHQFYCYGPAITAIINYVRQYYCSPDGPKFAKEHQFCCYGPAIPAIINYVRH